MHGGGNVPGTNFVGGTIPDACISSVARAILKLYPQPNAGGENLLPVPRRKAIAGSSSCASIICLRKTDQIFADTFTTTITS